LNARLLDTNVLIDLTRGRSDRLSLRFSDAVGAGDALVVSTISVFEFRFGAERSLRRDSQLAGLARFLGGVEIIDFDPADAEAAARIKADLAARGQMIGAYDLLIAAQASTRDLTVVTGNVREFGRVPGLRVEDWTA
jgi:tRNA(fMet)-specific endonuclease VapC